MKKRTFSLFVLILMATLLVGCTKRLELKEMTYEAQTEVSKIEIEEPNMPIEIQKNKNSDNVVISYYSDDEYKLNVEMANSTKTLTLKREEDKTTFAPTITFQEGCKTTIYIPENYEGTINLNIGNGSLSVENVSIDTLDVKIGNGSVSFNGAIITSLAKFDVMNGSANFDSSNIKKLELEIADGSLNMNSSELSNRLESKIHNGSVKFNNVVASEYDINVTNGEVNLDNVECNTLLSVKVVTGSINVALRGKELDYKTTLSTNVGSTRGATTSGNKPVHCETNVGSVEVRYLG